METKEPDSRLSVRKEDLDDQDLYRLNQVINDLYSKISSNRDVVPLSADKFTRSGVVQVSPPQPNPVLPPIPGAPIFGSSLVLNLNGITTSINNGIDPLGNALTGLRIQNNASEWFTAYRDTQILLSDGVNARVTISSGGGSPDPGGSINVNDDLGVTNVTIIGGTGAISCIGLSASGTVTFSSGAATGKIWTCSNALGDGAWQNISSSISAGTGISISGTGTITISNTGVLSITGTTNQVVASASTGAITLSLPQSIATTSSVTFNRVSLANGISAGLQIKNSSGTDRLVMSIAYDSLFGVDDLYIDNTSENNIYIRPGSGTKRVIVGYGSSNTSRLIPNGDNVVQLGETANAWSDVYSRDYHAYDGSTWSAGWTGTFSTGGQTVTVQNGIITNVV